MARRQGRDEKERHLDVHCKGLIEIRITLRLVPEDDAWLIDTDLLEVLIDRIGTFADIARPLSQQAG
jgi:hypothetical protein